MSAPVPVLVCFLCEQTLSEPITLPCGDTACKSCLVNHVYNATFGVQKSAVDTKLKHCCCPKHPTISIPLEKDWKVFIYILLACYAKVQFCCHARFILSLTHTYTLSLTLGQQCAKQLFETIKKGWCFALALCW